MHQTLSVASLALAAILLTACTATSPSMTDPTPPQPLGCNADAAKPDAIGKLATTDVVDRARRNAGAQMARVLKPGQMVTMEYREGRLNVDVDAGNIITNLRCG